MTNKLRCLTAAKNGVTAIEYGLLAGLIAVAIVGAVTRSGQSLGEMFTATAQSVETAAGIAAAAR